MNELKLQELDEILSKVGWTLDKSFVKVSHYLISTSNFQPDDLIKLLNSVLNSPIEVIQYLKLLYGLRLSEAKLLYQEYSDVKLN